MVDVVSENNEAVEEVKPVENNEVVKLNQLRIMK